MDFFISKFRIFQTHFEIEGWFLVSVKKQNELLHVYEYFIFFSDKVFPNEAWSPCLAPLWTHQLQNPGSSGSSDSEWPQNPSGRWNKVLVDSIPVKHSIFHVATWSGTNTDFVFYWFCFFIFYIELGKKESSSSLMIPLNTRSGTTANQRGWSWL